MLNKISGSFIGSAIGDGFGYPTEFMSFEQIEHKWGWQGLREPIGEIIKVTDDTQMAIAVANAVMNAYGNNDISPQKFEEELRKEFIKWLNSE